MYCPRCGTENQPENRFCVSCGSELAGDSKAKSLPPRERIARLVGTTPRARLLSAATALALLVAIAAFLALKPSEDDGARNTSFTRAADRICVEQMGTVAALEQQALQKGGQDVGAFASALVSVVAEWRFAVQDLPASPLDAEAAHALDSALLDALIRAGALARVARTGSSGEIAEEARRVDEASVEVGHQIEQLGLDRCSELDV